GEQESRVCSSGPQFPARVVPPPDGQYWRGTAPALAVAAPLAGGQRVHGYDAGPWPPACHGDASHPGAARSGLQGRTRPDLRPPGRGKPSLQREWPAPRCRAPGVRVWHVLGRIAPADAEYAPAPVGSQATDG